MISVARVQLRHRPFDRTWEALLEIQNAHPRRLNKDPCHLWKHGGDLCKPGLRARFAHHAIAHGGVLRCDAIDHIGAHEAADEQYIIAARTSARASAARQC